MKNAKLVSVADFEKVMKSEFGQSAVYDWHGVAVQVTYTIPLTSMIEMVDSVVDSCFLEDGTYEPELKGFALKCAILERYANFRMPVDVHKRYMLVTATDAAECIEKVINGAQLEEIKEAIEEKIQARLDAQTDYLRDRVDKMTAAFEEILDSTKHVFDDVSEEDLKKLADAVENGKLDEEKVVKAYVEQTMPDDDTADESQETVVLDFPVKDE